jgi:hypothetical protein
MVSETTHWWRAVREHLEAAGFIQFSRSYKIEFIRAFKRVRNAFVGEFKRQFNSIQLWSVNLIRFVTEKRQVSRCWRLYFVCYTNSNHYNVIIICSYDLWVSHKSIHLIPNQLLLVTLTPNTWQYYPSTYWSLSFWFSTETLYAFLFSPMRATCPSHLMEQNIKAKDVRVIIRKYLALVSRLISRPISNIMRLIQRAQYLMNFARVYFSTLTLHGLACSVAFVIGVSHFTAGGVTGEAVASFLTSVTWNCL